MQTVAKGAKQDAYGRFGTADVVGDLDASWLDEMTCRMWVLLRLHHRGASCPGCGSPIGENQRPAFSAFNRIRCRNCGKYFNALSGTFLSGVKTDLRRVVMMAYLIGLGLPDTMIAKRMGVDRSLVWRYRQRFDGLDA